LRQFEQLGFDRIAEIGAHTAHFTYQRTLWGETLRVGPRLGLIRLSLGVFSPLFVGFLFGFFVFAI
jgi:hypothetical protein